MRETEWGTDDYGRRVICREWRNTDGQLHRTTGPAVEEWTVLRSGAHVLSYQAWYLNGSAQMAHYGTRVLEFEEWARYDRGHRMNGPSYRHWTLCARPAEM